MSEAERKRRQDYKRNRKKWILIGAVLTAVALILSLGSFLIWNRMNRTYYIEYTERGATDYKVQYKENTFFEEEWISAGQSYVTALVNGIKADFDYQLNMDTSNVAFDYTYEIVAELVVADKTSGAYIYNPSDVLIPKTTKSVSNSDTFSVNQSVFVDFNKYNTLANQFINVYSLKNAKSTLLVTLKVDVLSECDEFEANNENTHSVSINVPLGEENFSIEALSSVPTGESKVLACKGAVGQKAFLIVTIVTAALTLLLGIALLAFIYLTKNEDVNYSNKVRKILSAYRSFIQEISGDFDTVGYQLVPVKTFVEMLGIRDTIQSPILMSENADETRTRFFIPTNTKLLYVYTVEVENYDELYANHKTEEEKTALDGLDVAPCGIAEPASMILKTPSESFSEAVVEAEASEECEAASEYGDFDTEPEDDSDGSIIYYDENENKLKIKCRRSCLSNIIQSENSVTKTYYSEIKNYILSYKGVKARMSWRFESFNKGRRQLFKLKIRGKTICLFCALDPNEFDVNRYYHKAVDSKAYEQVPMLIRIRSERALKRAKKVVDIAMEKMGLIKNPAYEARDYVAEHPYERTQALIDRGLIKILVPDGYVVADPHHIIKAEAALASDNKNSSDKTNK